MRKHLTLNYVSGKKKVSLKAQLEKVWEQTGVLPSRLEELLPDIPQAGSSLWGMFWDIKTGEEISWIDVISYMQYIGIELEYWEIQTIFAMNGAYNKYIQDVEMPKKEEGKKPPQKKGR